MGKATGFIDYTRQKPKDRNPLTRLSIGRNIQPLFQMIC